MLTVGVVVRALVRAGELQATRRAGGFWVEAPDARTIVVRWYAPKHQPDSAAGLAFLEEYAHLLRNIGVAALITTDRADPRVLVQRDS